MTGGGCGVSRRREADDRARPERLEVGPFSVWLRRERDALRAGADIDVPCGACNACCTSSYFVHVQPGEEALDHIPATLLFPAPGEPEGTMVLGYNEAGRCPMLGDDGKCSIYEHRPLTCRTYDCRVFAAAGTAADRPAITRQAGRWLFGYPTETDRAEHAAVLAAAGFLKERGASFPFGAAPTGPVEIALAAIKVYEVFLPGDGEAAAVPGPSTWMSHGPCTWLAGDPARDALIAREVIAVNERFEAARTGGGADTEEEM